MKKRMLNWLYEKYLDWRLRCVYPNGISEEEYQETIRQLARRNNKKHIGREKHIED